MKNLKLTRPLAVMDIETTGLNPQEDRIIEISIIKLFPDGKEEILNSLINPERSIPAESTQIHKITDADVIVKPTFNEFAQKVIDFIRDCDLCGFQIAKFDLSVLESEFNRAGVNYLRDGIKIIDVLKIYHKLEPRDLSSAYLKYCGKFLSGAHRSENDARAVIEILEAQLEKHDFLPKGISELHEFCNPKDSSWIDEEGKLTWLNGKAAINFGKHRGRTLEEIYKNEPDYFKWILNTDFSSKVKEIIKEAMTGKFPKQL